MVTATDNLLDRSAHNTPCASDKGARIVNGISIVLPLLAAAHSPSGDSIADNLTILIQACKELIDEVMKEARARGVIMDRVAEAVVHSACLNTIIINADKFLAHEPVVDNSDSVVDVLTAVSVSRSRMLSDGPSKGQAIRLAASVEAAAAVAIFVANSQHVELQQKEQSIEIILSATDSLVKRAIAVLDTKTLLEDDVDKINSVITREVTRVMLAVIDHFLSRNPESGTLNECIASASHVSNAFISGIYNTSSSWGDEE